MKIKSGKRITRTIKPVTQVGTISQNEAKRIVRTVIKQRKENN